jgi:hypothetical protein
MVIVAFKPGEKEISKYEELDQYDYGQILRIQGLNLPPAVEIHFALQKTGGTSKTRIGITKDGVTDVPIPDSMLENGDTEDDYSIYAFIYITDETSGQTEYRITLRVKARPKPEVPGGGDNPDIFHEVMETVREAMEAAAESERQAEGWAHGSEDLPERLQDNAKYYSEQAREDSKKTDADRKEVGRLVESVSGIGEQVEKVEGLTKQAQTSATNAALSEQKSEEAATRAETAQAGAETAEGNAELAAQKTGQDKTAVEQAKKLVQQMGQEILDNKNAVDKTVQDFGITAQQALADVNNAGQAQTERVQTAGNDAVESVKAAQGTATRAVETAKTEAIEAVQTEGTTQAGNVSAEGEKQVQAVRGAAQEIMADREQIQENKTGIAKLKEDIVGLDNRKADAIVETASGTPLDVTDSAKLPIQNLRVFGKSEQNGVPSLDAPVPIVNVGEKGNVDIKINTGNLFDINAVKKYEVDNTTLSLSASGNKIIFNSKISTGKEAIVNIINKPDDMLRLLPGKYTLSYNSNKPFGATNGTDTVEMFVCIHNNGSTRFHSTGNKNWTQFEIKEGDRIYLRFDINKSGQSAEFYDIMLNHGESVLPYESYFNQSLTLSTPNGLPGIKVELDGNYTDSTGQQWVTDEIDLERGKYIQRVKKLKPLKQVVFNKRDENGRCSVFDIGIFREIFKGGNIPAISSIAKWSTWGNKEDNTFALAADGIYYKDSTKTLEEVNTLFEKIGTNFEVCGVLETSVEHDLALETISSFKSLHTNYPTTFVSNNGDAEMELTYIADTKKYIDKKFEELNQAIVNTQIALL